MTWYQEGTVTVTQGSATITGAGTDWQDQAQGWQVQIDGETPLGEIDAVLSPTEIRLRNPVTRASATGLAYRITPTQGLNQALRAELAEVLSAVNTARNAIQSFEQTYTPQSLLTDLLTVDGADSGLDADLFRGRDDAFYRNADNLISGRVQEARLSGSYDISITGDAATATNATQLAGELPAFYRNADNLNAGKLPTDRLNTTHLTVAAGGALTNVGTQWSSIQNCSLTVPETGKYFVGYTARCFSTSAYPAHFVAWSSRITNNGVTLREVYGANMHPESNNDTTVTGAFAANLAASEILQVSIFTQTNTAPVDIIISGTIDIFRIG